MLYNIAETSPAVLYRKWCVQSCSSHDIRNQCSHFCASHTSGKSALPTTWGTNVLISVLATLRKLTCYPHTRDRGQKGVWRSYFIMLKLCLVIAYPMISKSWCKPSEDSPVHSFSHKSPPPSPFHVREILQKLGWRPHKALARAWLTIIKLTSYFFPLECWLSLIFTLFS